MVRVTPRRDELSWVHGAVVEPKRASVAAHYRLVPDLRHSQVADVVQRPLEEYPDELQVIPANVYELSA